MRAENQNDLAILHWETLSEMLRNHGVHEDEIRKCGQSYKQGFAEGFTAGVRLSKQEEREPCIGFETGEENETE